jgi:FMN phosphatase YigB (HAD superfamily)
MAKINELKALFFDIFGTCVDWRKTVTEALIDAAKQAGDTKLVLRHQHNSCSYERHC